MKTVRYILVKDTADGFGEVIDVAKGVFADRKPDEHIYVQVYGG